LRCTAASSACRNSLFAMAVSLLVAHIENPGGQEG